MIKRLLMALVLFLLTVSYVGAVDFRTISAEELKQTVDAKKQATIVDARTEKEFREGHVPGAVNVPPEKVGFISTLLPRNKNGLIIFYCRGAG